MTWYKENGPQQMIADIEQEVKYTRSLIGKDALEQQVMDAMLSVPRDAFVPDSMKSLAFANGPLSIGHGQTISQPYIVALMTDLLALEPTHRVLEIGTGSGYQSAVVSLLCDTVYSLEVISGLADKARRIHKKLGYKNIHIQHGNGYKGWPEHAPYDGIIVTAAAPYIPERLIEQLRPGGRLVIPVGLPYTHQELMLLTKDEQGETDTREILGVAFVPLVNAPATADNNR